MKTLADRLKEERENKGLSQIALANKAEVSNTLIYKLEAGLISESRKISRISAALGLNTDWLTTGMGRKYKTNMETNNVSDSKEYNGLVPMISKVQAGLWCEKETYEVNEDTKWYVCPAPHSSRTYCMTVDGDSMVSPIPGAISYNNGAIIYVDPDAEVVSGRCVIARIDGSNEATFKEYRVLDGRHFLKPLNTTYPTYEITNNIHICGVVIGQYIPC